VRAGRLAGKIVVVLEGQAVAAADWPQTEQFHVLSASGNGDDAIVTEVRASGERTVVVTADRDLKARVQRLGARTEAPSRFLILLEPATE
jgi:rRNA-processing protein FCF1